MNQSSREKIALIVFSIAVVLFFAAVITYIVIAHSWNLAARTIDEHRGAMEGYTVFVYAGNQEPTEKQEDTDEALPALLGGDSDEPSAHGGLLQDETQMDASVTESTGGYPVDVDMSAESSDGGGDASSPSAVEDSVGQEEYVSVESVEDSYRSKDAAVLTVDISDPSRYEGDDIYLVDGRRIGVFYVAEGSSLIQLIERVEYFSQHDIDFLLCLTDDSDFIELDSSRIGAVLAIGPDAGLPSEVSPSRTVYFGAPEIGKVGAILISPDGVVSSKVHSTTPKIVQSEDSEDLEPSEEG